MTKFLFLLLLSIISFNGYTSEQCLNTQKVLEVSMHFRQLVDFIDPELAEICPSKVDDKVYQVMRSLVLIKDLKINVELADNLVDREDALTYQAIEDKNWWDYLTKRANEFNFASCPRGAIAYVQRGHDQVVNLCAPFFDHSPYEQISVLLHEVRHFDGHGHVTCTRGNERGAVGACDQTIHSKGSYALSVQSMVALLKQKETPDQEKLLLEASAVYMAFNKFNIVPKVKINEVGLISNSNGELYNWTPGLKASKLYQFESPVYLRTNTGDFVTLYSKNTEKSAVQVDRRIKLAFQPSGGNELIYNKLDPETRSRFKGASNKANGGILFDNSLITFCKSNSYKINELSESNFEAQAILNLKLSKYGDEQSFLLSKTGDMYQYSCISNASSEIKVVKTDLTWEYYASTIKDTFILNGINYAIAENGTIFSINITDGVLRLNSIDFPLQNSGWISGARLRVPNIIAY
jgi:hypothetical protein